MLGDPADYSALYRHFRIPPHARARHGRTKPGASQGGPGTFAPGRGLQRRRRDRETQSIEDGRVDFGRGIRALASASGAVGSGFRSYCASWLFFAEAGTTSSPIRSIIYEKNGFDDARISESRLAIRTLRSPRG